MKSPTTEFDSELTLLDEAGDEKAGTLSLPTYPENMADKIREACLG